MEEENKHLVEQNQSLAKENRALLERSLESRDQHHNQQREYLCVSYTAHTPLYTSFCFIVFVSFFLQNMHYSS